MENLDLMSPLEIAQNYYNALILGDLEGMAQFCHPDIEFIGPLATMTGRHHVLNAAKNLSHSLEKIDIRAKFSSGQQVMMAYDFYFTHPKIRLRAAVLMMIDLNKITKIELFYDARPFEKMADKLVNLKNE